MTTTLRIWTPDVAPESRSNGGRRSRKLQKHSSPSTVMKCGILPQNPRNIFREKGDTFLHNENRLLHNNPTVQHSRRLFFSISFHTAVHSYPSTLKADVIYWSEHFGQLAFSLSWSPPWTETEPTHIALLFFEMPSNRKHD